ncbi:MAG: DMT family transporter [Brevibacillus sp.]|nr:DMT family transporter [Brevibacillus sp.]
MTGSRPIPGKALNYIGASRVQLFELMEPVFATVFAFLFLQELIKGSQWLGCGLILLAIYIAEYQPDTRQQEVVNQG